MVKAGNRTRAGWFLYGDGGGLVLGPGMVRVRAWRETGPGPGGGY